MCQPIYWDIEDIFFVMPINQRLRELREHLDLGRGAFSDATGIPKKTIEHIEVGNQKINGDHMEVICEKYPQYAYWLVTGKTLPEAGQTSPELEKIHDLHFNEGAA